MCRSPLTCEKERLRPQQTFGDSALLKAVSSTWDRKDSIEGIPGGPQEWKSSHPGTAVTERCFSTHSQVTLVQNAVL